MKHLFLAILFLSLAGLSPRGVAIPGVAAPVNLDNTISASLPTFWLDPDYNATIATGLSAWVSRAGAVSFVQATGSAQATPVIYNGKKVWSFDRTANQHLSTATQFGQVFTNALYSVIFFTVPANSDNATQQNPLSAYNSGSSPINPWAIYTLGDSVVKAFNYDGSSDSTTGLTFTKDLPYVLTAMHYGGNHYLTSNGVTLATGATGNTQAVTPELFIARSNTLYYGGKIGVIIGWNRELNATEYRTIHWGLCRKYGVSCN